MTEDEVLAGFEAAHEQHRSAAHEMESLNRLKDVPHPALQRRHLILRRSSGNLIENAKTVITDSARLSVIKLSLCSAT
jgi:hypothetical protein